MKPGDIDVLIHFTQGRKLRLSTEYHFESDGTVWYGRLIGELTETTGINGPVSRESASITRGQIQFIMNDGELDWVLGEFAKPIPYYRAQITDCDEYGDVVTRERYLVGAKRADGVGTIDLAGPELVLDQPLDTVPRRRGYGYIRKLPLEFVETKQFSPSKASLSVFKAVPFCDGAQPDKVYKTDFSVLPNQMVQQWFPSSGTLRMGVNVSTPAFTTSAWTGWWNGTDDGGWTLNSLSGQPHPHINASHPPKDLVGTLSLPSTSYIDQTVVLGHRGLRDNPHPHNETPSLSVTALGETFRYTAYPEDRSQTTVFKEFNSEREIWGTNRITLSGQHDTVTFAVWVGIVPKPPIYANVRCSRIEGTFVFRTIKMAQRLIEGVLPGATDSASFASADSHNSPAMGVLVDDASKTTRADLVFPLINSTGYRLVERYGKFYCVDMAPPTTATREITTYREAEIEALKPPQAVYVRQRLAWSGDEEQDYDLEPTNPAADATPFDTYADSTVVYNRIEAWRKPAYSITMSGLREPKLFVGDHIRLPVAEQQLLGKPAIVLETTYRYGGTITAIRARAIK